MICSAGGEGVLVWIGASFGTRARTSVDTGEESRITIVSSASKMSFSRELERLTRAGGGGISCSLTLLGRLSDRLEKIPEVHVWYFRFLDDEGPGSSEDVLGRVWSPKALNMDGWGGDSDVKTSIGSLCSIQGVLEGEPVLG
jgi:hypothetical protein